MSVKTNLPDITFGDVTPTAQIGRRVEESARIIFGQTPETEKSKDELAGTYHKTTAQTARYDQQREHDIYTDSNSTEDMKDQAKQRAADSIKEHAQAGEHVKARLDRPTGVVSAKVTGQGVEDAGFAN